MSEMTEEELESARRLAELTDDPDVRELCELLVEKHGDGAPPSTPSASPPPSPPSTPPPS